MENFDRLRWVAIILLSLILTRIIFIPLQIAIALSQSPQPEAIFVLGGGQARELAAIQLAQTYPNLPIWISSGQSPEWTRSQFQQANIPLSRLNLDYCAVDTVTNFTCLVSRFKHKNIQHVYLLTSDFHMNRAIAIAFFIFGSQSIAFTPIQIPSQIPTEPLSSLVRDSFRSLIWLITGRSLITVHPRQN